MIYYASDNPNGFVTGKRFSVDEPCVTVMGAGMGGDSLGHWHFIDDGGGLVMKASVRSKATKPLYRVPLMAEIAALPQNGLTVVSTFSGCGGSSLGFRMAGYKVLWANEFVPAAQDSYRANMGESTILDRRDIREVTPESILKAIGMKAGQVDVLEGSPPCQAFSTAGRREKGWGKERVYEHGAHQKNEDLFFEYVRLLGGIKPKVFVAENVSGLVKGVAKGYFLEILAAMKENGYRVTCRVLDAQWLGVPQQRQRTIFIGVRNDLNLDPIHPAPLSYRYSVRDALPWLQAVESGPTGFGAGSLKIDGPAPTLSASAQAPYSGHKVTPVVIDDGYPKANQAGDLPQSYVRAGRPLRVIHDTSGQFAQNVDVTDKPCPAITVGVNSLNSNHFKVEEETDISRYAIGDEWDKLTPGEQSDKYFSLVKVDADGPSPTIQASSGSFPSAAQPLHPTEKRKFTIAELKRICAFPDDFILTGTYAQQWERLGNSVPPVMMFHIAAAIRDKILLRQK